MEANRESSSEDDEQTKFDLDMKYSSSNTGMRF
jgi:hypothetical protein